MGHLLGDTPPSFHGTILEPTSWLGSLVAPEITGGRTLGFDCLNVTWIKQCHKPPIWGMVLIIALPTLLEAYRDNYHFLCDCVTLILTTCYCLVATFGMSGMHKKSLHQLGRWVVTPR